ncbi:MAG: glycosyltransferase [Rhodobacteraceae bacterium]|nr:glycosyltransferase [Paracoccaceae bacterium]
MKLTLAIPAHNDLQYLCRLLKRAAALGCADHIIVVDDGSDTPIAASFLLTASGLNPSNLTLLRHETARGAGAARNLALKHVATDHVLFLDADDLPTRELPHLMTDLKGHTFDFCIFKHHDTRMARQRVWGPMPHDQALWRMAGVGVGALTSVSQHAATLLCLTANYPWNKIYRTGFLRDNRIECSEIPVHNDVELHWRSFINTRHILASDRIAGIHFVSEDGKRLTNRSGVERFKVLGPLQKIAYEIDAQDASAFALPFFRFTIGLFDWISNNISSDLQDQFSHLATRFFETHIPPAIQEFLAQDDPILLNRVLHRPPNSIPGQTGD